MARVLQACAAAAAAACLPPAPFAACCVHAQAQPCLSFLLYSLLCSLECCGAEAQRGCG